MNIAQQFLAYYENEDFKNNYSDVLFETFNNEESMIINRIITLFNVQNYETEEGLSNHKVVTREQAKQIYDFIVENFEEFTNDFSGYSVGYTSLSSVSFGEQEEQLEGVYNNKTGKEYSTKYLKNVCGNEGFYINGNYAYYDLSDEGVYIDLLNNIELLNEFLATI